MSPTSPAPQTAREGARTIVARSPDVELVDVDLGDGRGTDLANAMAAASPTTAIALYAGSISSVVIDGAVNSGDRALVLKASPIERVADAIRAAAAGSTHVDRAVARMVGQASGQRARRTSKRGRRPGPRAARPRIDLPDDL